MATKVLIADDSTLSRKMLIKALPESWDINVCEAANGNEALEKCKSESIDLMFLDLSMPVMNGYETLEALREQNIQTPVIIVSADIQTKTAERVKSLGAIGFLKKPVEMSLLLDLLKENGFI